MIKGKSYAFNEPLHCYGTVAMIDALGARKFTIEQCVDFFKVRHNLIEKSLSRWEIASRHEPFESTNSSKVKIHIQSFADTLILAVQMKEFGSIRGNLIFPTGIEDTDNLFYGMWLERLAYVLGDLIRDGLYNGIVFRGAMSAGEFVLHEQSNSILGPAIVDVAEYYESFESFGIILTSRATTMIDGISKFRNALSSLKKTSIKFKKNVDDNLYAVNWPNAFCKEDYSTESIRQARTLFFNTLSNIKKSLGSNQKYDTAISFFNTIVQNGTK